MVYIWLELFNLKTRHNMGDACFAQGMKLLANMFPNGNTLSMSRYEANKLVCAIGMEYENIHAR